MRNRRWAVLTFALLAACCAPAVASDFMVNRPGCCITEPIDCNENTSNCICSWICGPKKKVCDCTCEDVADPNPPRSTLGSPNPSPSNRRIRPTDDAGISLNGQPLRVAEFARYLRATWKIDVHVSEEVAGVMLPTDWEMSDPLEAVLIRLGHVAGIRITTIKNGDTVAIALAQD